MTFCLREATRNDVPQILAFIKELAEYEHMQDQVVATEEILSSWLFEKQKAEVLIGEWDGQPVGFSLFFHNFSTFLGRAGIFIEDLYVQPHMRGKGLGKLFFQKLAQLCVERGCGRLEWNCLDWNKPSIEFYLLMGGIPQSEWTTYRITGEKLCKLAETKQ